MTWMFGYFFSTDAHALEMVAEIGAPARPVSSKTLPLPCSWVAIHSADSCSPLTKFEKILYAHGAVTAWSKLTTTMPLSQACWMTGFSAVGDEAATRMASGFFATIAWSDWI